jgi:Cof subfamily protein (haloacid dehalogenase superfamily)
MTGSIRLVATDLDGTLLRDDGSVSEYTRAILRRVMEVAAIVLVTARPPRTARLMSRAIGVEGAVICCNGALVYDVGEDRVIAHRPIASEDAQALIKSIRAALPGACFAFELGTAYGREATYRRLAGDSGLPEDTEVLIGDALELCAVPVTKLIVRHSAREVPELIEAIQAAAASRMTVTHSGAPFVEISMAGVDKASALAALATERGIGAEEVVSFGDMPNDLPMLLWSGRGIAVANAHPDVTRAVSELTESNADDGVAHALERLLLDRVLGR